MNSNAIRADLGFTKIELPLGTHICQIFSDDDERNDTLLQFLLSGLQNKERTACFSEKIDDIKLQQFLAEHGSDLEQARSQGDLITADVEDVYFQEGRFDSDRMLNMLTDFHNDALKEGYRAARVIGEMSPKIHKTPGGSRLFDYEAGVNQLLKKYPVTAVCQYDAHGFDGATIMDVMKVHPMMLVRGNVIYNPFYTAAP